MESLSNKQATNWCVYMHENRENGKKYIGITGQKPTHRWNNGHGYNRCPLFYAAICKYGWDAFRHEILYTNLTQDEAEKIEIELIAKYKSNDHEYGYNLASGGSVNAGFKRSEDFCKKVGERGKLLVGEKNPRFGTHHTEETKQKIKASNLGKTRSDDVRKKMSDSAKKRWSPENVTEREYLRRINLGENSGKAKAIVCVETGVVYSTISDAARAHDLDTGALTKCCKGKRNTAGGLHWRYVAEAVIDND